MASWSNMKHEYDAYIQWIEYSLLTNVREMTSLRHGCTHVADWLEQTATRVILKRIVDEQTDQLFDFHQVNYFTCKMQIVLLTCVLCITDYCCNDCIMYLFTQIANQGIL